MNIYLRYFDSEILVKTIDEALDYLVSTLDINVDEFMEKDLRKYVASSANYAKHVKVSNHSYFIVIKTQAETMAAFKQEGVARRDQQAVKAEEDEQREYIQQPRHGWYEASIMFRRVLTSPLSGKSQYVDTTFRAKVLAESVQHCYERIIEHLKNRPDVDSRSQYPGVKNRNFECTFLG